MKGKTMVIGIVVFVVLIVAAVYFSMMATINKIKEDGGEEATAVVASVQVKDTTLFLKS